MEFSGATLGMIYSLHVGALMHIFSQKLKKKPKYPKTVFTLGVGVKQINKNTTKCDGNRCSK